MAEKKITINTGMVTHYNDLIEKYVDKYIKENYRVKSPVIQYLRQIINTIESGLGNKISLTKLYLICYLTIEVNILKVHFVTIEIKNPNDDKKREFQISEGGFGTMSMLECNKSFIKFIHQFNREYEFNDKTKIEENNKIIKNQVDIFVNKLKDQLKIVDDKLEEYENYKKNF